MNTKVLKWMLLLAAPAIFPSCNSDDDNNDYTSRTTFTVYNHVAPLNGGGNAKVSKGNYTLSMNIGPQTLEMMSNDLSFDGKEYVLGTQTVAYKTQGFTNTQNGGYSEIYSFNSGDNNIAMPGTGSVTGLKAIVSPFMYFNKNVALSDYPTITTSSFRLAMNYTYDNALRVKTFYPDSFFGGKTKTTYTMGGQAGEYTTEKPMYRLYMDINKGTADVIIYSVQFADKMPELTALVVKGLRLTFTADGYVAEGKDIVPDQIENGSRTPNPRYVFKDIKVTNNSSNLVSANIEFNVADSFHGSFNGDYMWLGQTK